MRMKKLMIVVLLMAMSITAKALSYETARSEALFLSDKMAYELNLTASQYEAVYEINLDYFLYVGSTYDLYGNLWKQRNFELQCVLTPYQYETFLRTKYFYRPLGFHDGRWEFRIYRHYQNRSHFLMVRPRAYSNYRGGSHFGPEGRPGRGNAPRPGGARPPQQGQRPAPQAQRQPQRPQQPPQAQPQQRPPQQGAQRPPQQGAQRPPQQGAQRPPQQGQRPQQGAQPQQRPQQQGQRSRR